MAQRTNSSKTFNRDFSRVPGNPDLKRSTFKRNSNHKTTFDVGKLIPIFLDEVYPGDTFNINTTFVARAATPVYPVMDNSYLTINYFFVPTRLVWDGWEQFNGENKSSPWAENAGLAVPQMIFSSPSSTEPLLETPRGSLADYFGVYFKTPAGGTTLFGVNALPFRAYHLIWNEWFRDQNTQSPLVVSRSNASAFHSQNENNVVQNANKFHDYFTSALPAPQKGSPVGVPLSGLAQVVTGSAHATSTIYPGLSWSSSSNGAPYTTRSLVGIGGDSKSYPATSPAYSGPSSNLFPNNLYAELSSSSIAINELRMAVQLQRLLERDARGGTRYTEMIRSHFGVISPDSRLQRPEFLGGHHVPINISQVLQTSATDASTPLGQTGGFSLTSGDAHSFTKSFSEHGYVIGLATVRTAQTYSQGTERMWFRRQRTDFYLPVLANIGEQPIYKRELFSNGDAASATSNTDVFGYQEAWADLRYKPNRVSGLFRPQYTASLAAWSYTNNFANAPVLGSEFIKETDANFVRTIAVPSEPHFIAEFLFENTASRVLPLYSVPGMLDRN